MIDLTGKTFVITGASSGIGRATCYLVDSLGGSVVMVGRNQESLLKVQSTLTNLSFVETLDFDDSYKIEPWFDFLVKKVGPLDGIAHCAGIQIFGPSRLLNINEAEKSMRVNVNSGLILAHCLRRKGYHTPNASLVYISSVVGCVGAEFRSVYGATKGAIISMTKSLALEFVRDDVRVNCVAPGFVKTKMLDDTRKVIGDEAMAKIERAHPLGFGEPEDVANAIVFLLSSASKWITGTTLVVDGGYTAQ